MKIRSKKYTNLTDSTHKRIENNSESSHWKFGLFYYNKNDKRLFPPKRLAWMGWTVNFANPYSILASIVLILVALLLIDFFR